MGGVLLYCGHPAESVLPRGFICEIGLDKIAFYLTELNLTDKNWLLDRRPLNVTPDRSEYSLGAFPEFGRPVVVETKDDSNPYHVRREIPVIDFQDRKLLYDGPNAGMSEFSYPHTARSMSVYMREGDKKISVDPVPGVAATYTIYYELDRQAPSTLADSAFPLEQFNGLLKAAIALTCLAHCGCEDTKHARLESAITEELADYRTQFEKYIKQDSQAKTSVARGFMTDDYEAWYF